LSGLGTGRFTRVYLAEDYSRQSYALKYYPPEYAGMGAYEENILRNLALNNIAHVPSVATSLWVDNSYALSLSPVGVPILPAPIAVSITPALILPILHVLEHVHGLGIIHRDVKPENIYLNANDTSQVILNDWGSCVMTPQPTDFQADPCFFQGTPLYGEQHIRGQMQVPTKRLDLCSLVKTVFVIKQQKIPPCGTEWSDITNYWISVSRDFPEFQTVFTEAESLNYDALRRFFGALWC